ncbi:hypothetical protein [Bartonella saheliensis]|nr:hypothetical protein [Bartonella saheliensis]
MLKTTESEEKRADDFCTVNDVDVRLERVLVWWWNMRVVFFN